MLKFFNDYANNFARKIRQSFEGLSEDMPKIVWVKAVENLQAFNFIKTYNTQAAEKIKGVDIIMKAEDGRFFTRMKYDNKPVWHGEVEGERKTFISPVLDTVLADAFANGMTPTLSRNDVFATIMAQRRNIIMSGSQKSFETLDRDVPRMPREFSDFNTPEDYDQSHPEFAAYLRRSGLTPFKITPSNSYAKTDNILDRS